MTPESGAINDQQRAQAEKLANRSLALGILSLLCVCVTGIPAVYYGYLVLTNQYADESSKTKAKFGIATGIGLTIIMIIFSQATGSDCSDSPGQPVPQREARVKYTQPTQPPAPMETQTHDQTLDTQLARFELNACQDLYWRTNGRREFPSYRYREVEEAYGVKRGTLPDLYQRCKADPAWYEPSEPVGLESNPQHPLFPEGLEPPFHKIGKLMEQMPPPASGEPTTGEPGRRAFAKRLQRLMKERADEFQNIDVSFAVDSVRSKGIVFFGISGPKQPVLVMKTCCKTYGEYADFSESCATAVGVINYLRKNDPGLFDSVRCIDRDGKEHTARVRASR